MNNAEFVEAVNKRQIQLKELSHDDLRKAFVSVKARIDNDNIDETDILVEVFAIVKDSCRRFSENDIVDVLYGDLDKTNTSYDFVKSYENVYPFDKVDYVGYKSTWLAAGEEIKWSIVPYDEQILAGLELHRGKIIQMATGEGKTFVAIAPTVANYVLHHHVHIMTVNDYLSKRDFELTRPIYAFLGINVACITGTNRYGYLRTKAYEADVTFGTFSDFIFDYLYDHIAESKDKQVQKDYDFVIVDEADSILIDEGVTPHIIESSDNDNQMQNLFDFYLAKVKYFLEDSVNEKLSFDVLQKSVTLKEHGKKVLTEICQMPYLFDDEYYKTGIKAIKDNPNYSTEQITAFVTEKKEEHWHQLAVRNTIEQLLRALLVYERDVDYIVRDGTIVIVDRNTGRPKEGYIWSYGLHEAVRAKEGVAIRMDSRQLNATISTQQYFVRYRKLAGMTGTALSAKKEFEELYNINVAKIPTHKPVIRVELPIRIFNTKEAELQALSKEVIELYEKKRPVLVGVNFIKESQSVSKELSSFGLSPRILNAITIKEESSLIAKAGEVDSVTVATSVAGRGTDIKPSSESLENGGLAVLGVGLSESIRVDEQLSGRTGRQGNPGMSRFYVSVDDDICDILDDEEKKQFGSMRFDDSGEVLSEYYERALALFKKAQSTIEENDRKKLYTTISKDKKIAVWRDQIYAIRDTILNKEITVSKYLHALIPMLDNEEKEKVYIRKKKQILETVLPLIRRSLENSYTSEKVQYVPFWYHNQVFSVPCDFAKAIESKGESLIDDFERTALFNCIEPFWIKFINEINSPYAETADYDRIYSKLYNEMTHSLENLIFNAEVATSVDDTIELENEEFDLYIPIHHGTGILDDLETLCPCKSGLPFYACHGRWMK